MIKARNLVSELIRNGVQPSAVVSELSEKTGLTQQTVRNKLNGSTCWTVPEAFAINDKCFGGKFSVDYLFSEKYE